MKGLIVTVFLTAAVNYAFSQTPVNITEGFEGSWLPAGWSQTQFSQSNVLNHTSGGTFSAAHNTFISGNGHLMTPYFDVINGEHFDTIAFWVMRTALSISGSVGVKIVAASGNDEDLQTIDLTALPSGTWERYSYSYSVIRDDQIALKLSVSNTVAAGTIFLDDFRVNKSTVMPVELLSFYSTVDKNNVTLNWTTAWEMNNSGFEVQRKAMNGNPVWSVLSFVQGHGTTNEPVNYSYCDMALSMGEYAYRLKQIDYNGNHEYYVLTDAVTIGAPAGFVLHQNYPNPSNPSSMIVFEIPIAGRVSLKVYDMAGREAAVLLNGFQDAGYHSVMFDGANLSSGIYFYKLVFGGFTETKKLIVLK